MRRASGRAVTSHVLAQAVDGAQWSEVSRVRRSVRGALVRRAGAATPRSASLLTRARPAGPTCAVGAGGGGRRSTLTGTGPHLSMLRGVGRWRRADGLEAVG